MASETPEEAKHTAEVRRASRYRLYPTAEQEQRFVEFAGVCRFVYNTALEQRRDFWRQYLRAEGRHISFASQSRELTQMRAESEWIRSAPATAQGYALQDLDSAFQRFFRGTGAYPRPRSRRAGHGFRISGQSTRLTLINAKWATVYIPKVGDIRLRLSRPLRGRYVSVSISRKSGAWHASFSTVENVGHVAAPAAAVGIDRGVAQTLTLSNGAIYQAPDTARLDALLRRAQRTAARRVKGSGRRSVAALRVAQLRSRAARVRHDWAHKTSIAIARDFGLVAIEDLNIRNMTASASGTVEEPGKGVAQKRGLNRAILAQSWGIFAQLLAYKIEDHGGHLVSVDPRHTSQTCASCGAINARSRESQAVFRCVECAHADNADVNAAKEILRRGTAWLDVEGSPGRLSKRQLRERQHV